ncbi:MAG: sulfatase-like hydrolase/transferase, partial [Thermofilum sp.]|nr:sulfatase-like hydrolase/transferase [Thermofilum sp.]
MAQGRYNVILVMTDSLRKDHVGCYGNSWIRTPNIDRFAKESVMYTKAYPESLPTIPVRRAVYTGKRVFPFEPARRMRKGMPWIVNAGWQPLSDEDVTLSEVFKAAGYRTALIGDNYHLFEPGMNFNRGFDEWIFIRGQE